jgi:hypothetical protein
MSFEVEYFILTGPDATNRSIQLTTGVPSDSSDVALDLIGGTAQAIGLDFLVDSTKVRWDFSSSNLYSNVAENDRMRVIYDKS